MRAVRTDCELQLQQKLIDRAADIAITGAAKLAANLTELRGPESERGRNAAISEVLEVDRPVGGVESDAGEPAVVELVIARQVEASEVAIETGAIVGDGL